MIRVGFDPTLSRRFHPQFSQIHTKICIMYTMVSLWNVWETMVIFAIVPYLYTKLLVLKNKLHIYDVNFYKTDS